MRHEKTIHPLSTLDLRAPRKKSVEVENFDAWLAEEIFTRPRTSSSHHLLGFTGFLIGAVSALVTYYLAFQLMKIFKADDQTASFVGTLVIIPRIALGGNALEDSILKLLHDYNQKAKLPRKKNQIALRYSADAFVYLSSFALGVMGIYILQTNLPYNQLARNILTPSILLGNGVVNVQPFLDANQAFFAKYSPGATPEIREKRAAMIRALNLALNEIKAKNSQEFGVLYEELTSDQCTGRQAHARMLKVLSFSEQPQQPSPAPKSAFTRGRGYFGWMLSLLSSLTNIQISLAEAIWFASVFNVDEDQFVQPFTLISSVLCVVAYGVLCAGPTQEVFEYRSESLGWDLSHPRLRRAALGTSLVLGALSAVPNASWPIVLGTTWYEQALAGPAFVSPASLYFDALNKRLNRWINAWDRYWGGSKTIDHMDFLDKLKTLPAAVAQLPDQYVDKLISTQSPLLLRFRESRESQELRTGSDCCFKV